VPLDLHRSIELADGRRLGFAEIGDPDGIPMFYFHGWPGSRLEARMALGLAERIGARILAVDRPGYGLSDFKPGRTLDEWPDDIEQLADALSIDRFAAVGASGGGPSLLACAHKIPHRLLAAGIVCGMGPTARPGALDGATSFVRFGFWLSRTFHPAIRLLLGVAAPLLRRTPKRIIEQMIRFAPESDRKALQRPELGPFLMESFAEAFRQGGRGAAHDLGLYAREWPFRLDQIDFDLRAWHGEIDEVVPAGMTRHLESQVPRCKATYFPTDGHFSIILGRIDEVFGEVIERARAPRSNRAV